MTERTINFFLSARAFMNHSSFKQDFDSPLLFSFSLSLSRPPTNGEEMQSILHFHRWVSLDEKIKVNEETSISHVELIIGTRTFWIHLFQRYLYQDRSLGWTFFQAHETASCSFDLMYSYVIIRASFLMQDWRILNYRSIIHTRLVRPFSKALKIYYERRDLKTHTESDKSLQFVSFSFDESLWSRISVN